MVVVVVVAVALLLLNPDNKGDRRFSKINDGCWPPGRRCCGSCASGRCDDVCIGPRMQFGGTAGAILVR
jgi:hypothetical protein